MDRIVLNSCWVKKNFDKQVVLGQLIYGTGQKAINPNSIHLKNVLTCLQPV